MDERPVGTAGVRRIVAVWRIDSGLAAQVIGRQAVVYGAKAFSPQLRATRGLPPPAVPGRVSLHEPACPPLSVDFGRSSACRWTVPIDREFRRLAFELGDRARLITHVQPPSVAFCRCTENLLPPRVLGVLFYEMAISGSRV